jgi:hypothetical protein
MSNTTHTSNRSIRPIAVAIAIALAVGLGANAQAQQYSYPGSASSSGRAVRDAAATERNDRYHAPQGRNGHRDNNEHQPAPRNGQPSAAGNAYGYANGTVHPIEAESNAGGRRAVTGEPRHEPARGYPQGGYGNTGNDYAHGTVHPIVAGSSNERGPAQPESREHGAGHGIGNSHVESGYGNAYHYPGNTVPRERPDIPSRADYQVAQPERSAHGNPSMQPGEACPRGTCGQTAPSASADDSRGTYANGTVTPVQAMSSDAHLAHGTQARPVQGYRSIAPTIGQSRTGVGSKSTVGSSQKFGQTGPVIGPNGQRTTIGGAQTITGPNGEKVTLGGSSFTGQETGPTSGSRHGGVSGLGDHQGGVHLPNGGGAGVADAPKDAPDHPTGKANSGGEFANWLNDEWGHPHNGKDSQGNTWQNGNLVDGYDSAGVRYRGGKPVQGGTVPVFKGNTDSGVGDDPDIGSRGGGTLVSGTGKGVDPGHRGGQDTGGGKNPEGTSDTGGGSQRNNATGAYVVTHKNGQDIPVKPKERGPMTNSYNGVKGVTDPKRGNTGGGG